MSRGGNDGGELLGEGGVTLKGAGGGERVISCDGVKEKGTGVTG